MGVRSRIEALAEDCTPDQARAGPELRESSCGRVIGSRVDLSDADAIDANLSPSLVVWLDTFADRVVTSFVHYC